MTYNEQTVLSLLDAGTITSVQASRYRRTGFIPDNPGSRNRVSDARKEGTRRLVTFLQHPAIKVQPLAKLFLQNENRLHQIATATRGKHLLFYLTDDEQQTLGVFLASLLLDVQHLCQSARQVPDTEEYPADWQRQVARLMKLPYINQRYLSGATCRSDELRTVHKINGYVNQSQERQPKPLARAAWQSLIPRLEELAFAINAYLNDDQCNLTGADRLHWLSPLSLVV